MKFFLNVLLLVLLTSSYGQQSLTGTVKGGNGDYLPFANVQLLDSTGTKLLSYGITNTNGAYSVSFKKTGDYLVKATYVGFEAVIKKVILEIDKEKTLDITLKEKAAKLDDVIIEFDPSLVRVSQDTIVYNLKRLTNGNEKNLENILEKLPGIKIDDNGKVSVNGKPVDKLLVDGEELFKNQHKLTTKNVSADMVEGVTFFDKYTDFANIEGFNVGKSNALNISIKDEYKNRITGNLEVIGAIKDKFLGHTNLFRFGGKLKLAFIGDVNNLGKESITFNDYLEFDNNVVQYSPNKDLSSQTFTYNEDDLPKFLQPTIDVRNRNIDFAALSLTYKPSITTKITAYSILNETSQKQFFNNSKRFFNDSFFDQQEIKNIKGKFLFSSSVFKIDYKPNKGTLFNYTVSYNPGKEQQSTLINNDFDGEQNIFEEDVKIRKYTIGQQLSLVQKLNDKSLLKLSGSLEFNKNKNDLSIIATNPFLGLNLDEGNFSIHQNKDTKQNNFGFTLAIENKLKGADLTFFGGNGSYFDRFDSFLSNSQDAFTNDFSLDRLDSFVGVRYNNKTSRIFKWNIGLTYHHFLIRTNEESDKTISLFPNAGFYLRLPGTQYLNFSYSFKSNFASINRLNPNNYIVDYLRVNRGNSFLFNQQLRSHNFDISYNYSKLSKGLIFFTNASFLLSPEILTANSTLQTENFSLYETILGDEETRFISSVYFEKRFKKLKFTLEYDGAWIHINGNNSVENRFAKTKLNVIQQGLKIRSNFRSSINYRIGSKLEYNIYENGINSFVSRSTQVTPFITVIGSHLSNRINWELGGEGNIFNSNFNSRRLLIINPKLSFLTKNKTWEFKILGNNILNINSAEIVQNRNKLNYFEESITNFLEGYIGFSTKYIF